MEKSGRLPAKSAIEQYLAESAPNEVCAAHDLCDVHSRIIDHASELIAGRTIFSPHGEIAEVHTRDGALLAGTAIRKAQLLAIRNAEAPGGRMVAKLGAKFSGRCRTARAGIDWLILVGVRGTRRGGHIAPGTDAGVNPSAAKEKLESLAIDLDALALGVGTVRAADVRSFVPSHTEPAQILDHRAHVFRADSRVVEVFVAEDQVSAGIGAATVRDPKRVRMAAMQEARGRWREASAIHEQSGRWQNGATPMRVRAYGFGFRSRSYSITLPSFLRSSRISSALPTITTTRSPVLRYFFAMSRTCSAVVSAMRRA